MADQTNRIKVSDIQIAWDLQTGTCSFEKLPVAMMWVDSTLAGLMAGVQAMVGTERFELALQSEGRKSVEADWQVISQFPSFEEGFQAIANLAAVAGWGQWEISSLNLEKQECCFRVHNSWEGLYQNTLNVCWGSGMLAGQMAGYCTKLFKTNCWAEQQTFIAKGDAYDSFRVKPSQKTVEAEIDALLQSDVATKADMAVALKKLQAEIEARTKAEKDLLKIQEQLENRVEQRTSELKASENTLKSILIAAPAGIGLMHNRVFSWISNRIVEMTGYESSELIGKSARILYPSEEEFLRVGEVKYKQLETEPVGEIITLWKMKSGDLIKIHLRSAPIDLNNFSKGITFTAVDITQKLKEEENVRKMEQQIMRNQKLESLGVLAGGIAHDFNNILTAILGNLSLISLSLPIEGPELELINEAERASLRAKDLTQQLLTFAKGGEPVKETASIAGIISDSAEFVLRGSNVACKYDIPENLWNVEIDKGQISQVIQNIIINAKNAMPNGGNISITCENVDDCQNEGVFLPTSNQCIKISISDYGIGIPAKIIDKIFEPYFTTKQEGSGLGLATTDSIVTKHKGYLSVKSQIGEGSTFFIYLPASDQKVEIINGDAVLGDTQQLNILIMDDEEMVQGVTKAMLTKLGHRVLIAKDGHEAIEVYKENQNLIDLIIMDLTIPGGMGGKEAAEKIQKINPDAKMIVASGYSNDPVLADYKRYGFCASLRKPFQFHELNQVISKINT